jgi:hypothetical protein
MAMEFLPFHNQFVADLLAHDEHNNLVFFHIIQGAKISCAQFKLG